MAVTVYDVGDAAPLALLIDEADDTTVATVTVRSPSGGERELAATPNEDRTEWRTALRLTEPGVWRTDWTVEGTGAGFETHTLTVRPAPGGRTYATTADLAAWTGDAPPLDAGPLLVRATRTIDRLMIGARWDPLEGSDNMPSDPTVAGAYRDATCAQVAAWLEQGAGDYGPPDDDSAAAKAEELATWATAVGASSVALGDLNIGLGKASTAATSSSSIDYTAPAGEAVDVFRTAGLYPTRIGVIG